jgi:hypothetical protein
MTMIKQASAAVIAIVALCPFGLSAETAPKIGGPRYSFYRSGDAFLRLDTQTGEVALCGMQPVGWACLTAPDDRVVLENEIVRLREENVALKQALLSRGLPLPPGTAAKPGVKGDRNDSHGNELTLRLPDDTDIDRVVALVGRLWHRFVEAVTNAQKQIMHSS